MRMPTLERRNEEYIKVRLTRREKDIIEQAALDLNVSVSDYVRMLVLAASVGILEGDAKIADAIVSSVIKVRQLTPKKRRGFVLGESVFETLKDDTDE